MIDFVLVSAFFKEKVSFVPRVLIVTVFLNMLQFSVQALPVTFNNWVFTFEIMLKDAHFALIFWVHDKPYQGHAISYGWLLLPFYEKFYVLFLILSVILAAIV